MSPIRSSLDVDNDDGDSDPLEMVSLLMVVMRASLSCETFGGAC